MEGDVNRPICHYETHEPIEIVWDKTVRVQNPASDYSLFNLNWHDDFEIKRFISGTAIIQCGLDFYEAQTGDIVIISPLEFHSQAWQEGTVKYDLVFVSPQVISGFSGLIDPDFLLHKRFQTLIRQDACADSLLCHFLEEYWNKDDCYEMAAIGYLQQFFAHLVRANLRETVSQENYHFLSDNSQRIVPAVQRIQSDYNQPLTIDELAQECCMTPYYFCRCFRHMLGISPLQYIIRQRMQHARHLLLNTALSLKEISESVGYPDVSYFCRLFRKIYQTTPMSLRSKGSM